MYAVKAAAKRNPEKIRAWSGCEPITLSIQMQCDYHKAIKAPLYSAIVAKRELVTL